MARELLSSNPRSLHTITSAPLCAFGQCRCIYFRNVEVGVVYEFLLQEMHLCFLKFQLPYLFAMCFCIKWNKYGWIILFYQSWKHSNMCRTTRLCKPLESAHVVWKKRIELKGRVPVPSVLTIVDLTDSVSCWLLGRRPFRVVCFPPCTLSSFWSLQDPRI